MAMKPHSLKQTKKYDMSICYFSVCIDQVNQTSVDWPLTASIEGQGFYGPPFILAKAMQTTQFPLMFRPAFESLVSVS